jgi:amidase
MTIRILRNQIFYAFSSSLSPVATVRQEEEFILETYDCFEGQIKKETDLANELDWEHINPATGPVYIDEVRPGDILCIDVVEIKVADQSIVTATPSQGVIGDLIQEAETAVLPVHNTNLIFNNHLKIPIRPMIGVIGVVPSIGIIPNGVPDRHGGNMDCNQICQSSRIYLTAQVPGALLGCGDLHSVMGDGEIVSTGAETDGEVKLKVKVVDLPGLPTPFLETADSVSTIYSAKTVDEAANLVTHAMADFLVKMVGLSVNKAGMLMSLVGQLKFCQIVDPQRTVRFEFPKWVLDEYGFKLLK